MIYTHNLHPVLLQLGPLQMRWYGLMYVIGFIAALFLFRRFSREGILKLSYIQIDSLVSYGFLGLFVGARIIYCLAYNFEYYSQHPLDIIAIWKGGLSFHGGLIGIAFMAYIFCRKNQVSFWHIWDNIVIVSPIGIGCGRLGNFINGELFGRPTNGSWGVIFPAGGAQPRHPSQLYESFFEGAVLFTIMYLLRGKLPQGRLSALFLMLYGLFRFGIEFFRQPDAQLGFVFLQFSMGQIFCVLMIIAGALLWFLNLGKTETVSI